jgi:nicotinate phosphoribosyltransferase
MPQGPVEPVDFEHSLLLTDLYQLNMVEAYLAEGMGESAVFEFFVRKLPGTRGFLMAAGLEQAIGFILGARCSEEELRWLESTGRFTGRLLDFLGRFRFSGHVDAMPEGTVFFPNEPVLRVTAPIAEGQLLETRLVNFLQYQALVASKAARMVLAAPGKALVDFGLRRAHSGEAGLLASRAAYIAGFAGTATVPAGQRFGIPIYGTMAHSYVQAHESEADAFLAFAAARPDQTVFLIDTYDTAAAAREVAAIAPRLAERGLTVRGVRIDSGDLGRHAVAARAILNGAGLSSATIVASGGIDEHLLARLTAMKAPIDTYGIGTSLVTSEDAPALDCAYKLKAYGGRAKRKRSEGKAYWAGPTAAARRFDGAGTMVGDTIGRAEEPLAGEPLLRRVVEDGRLVAPLPELAAIRRHAARELASLPLHLRNLEMLPPYPVEVSAALLELTRAVDRALGLE